MIAESFHFLRPAWLLALLPLALALWAAARSDERSNAWRLLVDRHLLRHLMVKDGGATRRWPLALATVAGLAAVLAMAGPAWQRLPQPTFASVAPTVLVLDMSPSMNADDLSPSRLARSRHKLQDILDRTRGGQVGLVVYADEPFVAAPLTDDARVIAEMVPTLESGLMPPRAGRTDRAIAQAQALLEQAGSPSGRVVLITDGVDEHADDALAAARALAASGRTLSVLGAATDAGAPLRDHRGGIVAGDDGAPVSTRLDRSGLEALARAGGGSFSELRADDADLATLLPARAAGAAKAEQTGRAGSSAQFDAWRDAGIWLVLIPLLLAPLAFRRGLVAAVALGVLLSASAADAETSAWSDLWNRRDQQAQAALADGDAAAAAALFEHPEWQAAAAYQSGSFAESAASYADLEGDENRYNLGNALARSGKLEEALAAYDRVLSDAPEHADAKFNRDLVQRLLDEQRKQQEQQNQQDQNQQQAEPQGGQGEQQNEQQAAQGDGAQQEQPSQGGGAGQQSEQQADAAGGAGEQQPPPQDPAQDAAASQQAANQNQDDSAQGAQAKQDAAAPQHDPAAAAEQEQGAEQQEQAAAAHDQRQQEQAGSRPAAAGDQQRAQADAGVAPPPNEAAQQDRSLEHRLSEALAGDDETKQQRAASDDGSDRESEPQQASSSADQRPLTEREQAREQALRSIPDDPGGLLRAKIRRRYAEKRYAQQEVIKPW